MACCIGFGANSTLIQLRTVIALFAHKPNGLYCLGVIITLNRLLPDP
jgi:hypothetical protein